MQKEIKTLGDSYLSTQKHFLLNDAIDIIDLHFKNICRNNAVLDKFKIKKHKDSGQGETTSAHREGTDVTHTRECKKFRHWNNTNWRHIKLAAK